MKIVYAYPSDDAIPFDGKKLLAVLPWLKDCHGKFYDYALINPKTVSLYYEDRNARPVYHNKNWINGIHAGEHPEDDSSANSSIISIHVESAPVPYSVRSILDKFKGSGLRAFIRDIHRKESQNNEDEMIVVINEPSASDVAEEFLYPTFGREDESYVISRILVMEKFPAVCLFFARATTYNSESVSVCYTTSSSSDRGQDEQVCETVVSREFLSHSRMRISILAIISSLRTEKQIPAFTSCVEYGYVPSPSFCIGETMSLDRDMQWAGNSDMRNSVEKYRGQIVTTGAYCHAPALIVDLNRMAVIGFTKKNSAADKFTFILDEHHHAIRWSDQSELKKDSDYRRWATRFNNNLESWCMRVENMAYAFPGHCHMTLQEKAFLSEFCGDQIIESRKPRKSKGDGICLDPVGFRMEPYLDRMVEIGYLERLQADIRGDKIITGYRRTEKVENYHLVLFAYLMNAKIASSYAELEQKDPLMANEWMLRYDKYGWSNNKEIGDISGKGSVWRKDRKGWGYRTTFVSYEISETRNIREKYFSRLLSLTEEDIRTLKSHATNTDKFTLVSRDIVELVKKVDDEIEAQRENPGSKGKPEH